jgi:hypothetical protein
MEQNFLMRKYLHRLAQNVACPGGMRLAVAAAATPPYSVSCILYPEPYTLYPNFPPLIILILNP